MVEGGPGQERRPRHVRKDLIPKKLDGTDPMPAVVEESHAAWDVAVPLRDIGYRTTHRIGASTPWGAGRCRVCAAAWTRGVDHVLIVRERITRSFKGRVLLPCFQLVTGGGR